ncbi:MAG: hypothetical protein DYG86_09350, partial [Chloroflexi bacterium CFX2]|nr:hypothetical protein [Chloroflexi bacterium CFX2]
MKSTFKYLVFLILHALIFGTLGIAPARAAANAGQWTWVDGSNTIDQSGIYGTEDIPDAANVPGARNRSVSWSDASGSLWLFGGVGRDSAGNSGSLNDLWNFDPTTGLWTWVGQIGIYGTEDVPDAANVPGARLGSVSWSDANGDLWLFGGNSYDSVGNTGFINDLWEFSAWHTVTFDANGGSGSMSPQTTNNPTALTANAFTRAGYSFNGWNTQANGSGTAYADGA